MKKMIIVLLALLLVLAGCGGEKSGEADSAGGTLNEDYDNALPVSSQLVIGTMMLDGTDDAVTEEQAQELLPVWQMLGALQQSGTAAPVEIEATLKQIQAAMTPAQLAAIKEMRLTPESMMTLAQERGFGRGTLGDAGGGGGGFRMPAGVNPGGGGGGGGRGAFGGGGFGGGNFNVEEMEATLAGRMNSAAGMAMTGMLVRMLQARGEGLTLEQAMPPQWASGQTNARALLNVLAQATGLDQQELMAQAREGKTGLEIIQASGADVDEIVAQIVALESERVNQAVAGGQLEQARADEILAGMEASVREMLEQPLLLGRPGAPDD